MMPRPLIVAAVLAVAFTAAPRTHAEPDRPNVLLILTDDQGYADLSIHGNPHLKTPHIDRLGKAGVRFDRFYVNSFCAPTRAALLTGRYPLRTGVYGVTHNKEAMRLSEVTIAEALWQGGYRTACIGKWHNGEQYPYTPNGQGFDVFFGFCNGHTNAYFDAHLRRGSTTHPTRGYISDVLTNEAIRFIRKQHDGPFFCYVSYNAPHSPFQVPDRYYDKFKAKGFDPATAAFYGMCENIDDNVGRLLTALDEQGLTRRTIVIFLTDNGGTRGVRHYNAGMRGGKTSVHEGGCRVPLFIRWPGRLKPRVVTQLTSHIDLYPTLLDLCRVEPPEGPRIDGVSLRPLLEGRDDWPHKDRVLFTHNPISPTNRYPGAVRTPRYRLVRTIKGRQGGSSAKPADRSAPPWRLYNMTVDPGEKRDLAKAKPDVVARLSKLYEAWYDGTAKVPLERFALPVGHAQENPVTLHAPQAYYTATLRFDHGPGFAHDWLTNWTDADAKVWFDLNVVRAGRYRVTLRYGCPDADAGSAVRVRADSAKLTARLPAAPAPAVPLPNRDEHSNQRYVNRKWGELVMGELELSAGRQRLTLDVASLAAGQVMDFKGVRLQRVGE